MSNKERPVPPPTGMLQKEKKVPFSMHVAPAVWCVFFSLVSSKPLLLVIFFLFYQRTRQ